MSWRHVCAVLIVLAGRVGPVDAADRLGVLEELDSLRGNWRDTNLQVTVVQLTSGGEVALSDRAVTPGAWIRYGYRADRRGFVQFIRVSSVGNIILFSRTVDVSESGTGKRLVVMPPLGTETAYAVLSERPLILGSDGLMVEPIVPRSGGSWLGNDRADASVVASQLRQAMRSNRIAIARFDYEVIGDPGPADYAPSSTE